MRACWRCAPVTLNWGMWKEGRRDVRADIRRLFGEHVTHIDAVAIMTDTDDMGLGATAYYQSLYFSDE